MRWEEHYLRERYWFFYSLIKPNRCTSFMLIKPTFPSPPFPFQFLQSGDFVHFLGFSQPPAAGQPVKSMNEEKWSAFHFSLQYHHWIKSLSHRNKGNDHLFKKFLTVKQILLVSSIGVVKRTVWRIQVLIIGAKELWLETVTLIYLHLIGHLCQISLNLFSLLVCHVHPQTEKKNLK